MANILQDDKGNWSSGRLVMMIMLAFATLVYFDWRWAFRIEMQKLDPHYMGIIDLFREMIVIFVGGIVIMRVMQIIQKKYENNK